jgi:hypothetical protein
VGGGGGRFMTIGNNNILAMKIIFEALLPLLPRHFNKSAFYYFR